MTPVRTMVAKTTASAVATARAAMDTVPTSRLASISVSIAERIAGMRPRLPTVTSTTPPTASAASVSRTARSNAGSALRALRRQWTIGVASSASTAP